MAFLAPLVPLLIPVAKKGAKVAYNHYKDNKSKDPSRDVKEELLQNGVSVSTGLMKKGVKAAYSKAKGKGKGKGKNKKTDGGEDEEDDEDHNLTNINQGGMNTGPRGNQRYYDQGQFGYEGAQGPLGFQTSGEGMNHNYVCHSQGYQGGWTGSGINSNPNQGHLNYGNPGYGGHSNVNQGYGGPDSAMTTYGNNGNWQGNAQYGNFPSGHPGNNMHTNPLSPQYHGEDSANGYNASANNIPTGLNQHPYTQGDLRVQQDGGQGRYEMSRGAQIHQTGDQSNGVTGPDKDLLARGGDDHVRTDIKGIS